MPTKDKGPTWWELTRARDGHREYVLVHQVRLERGDGPFSVLNMPDLPVPGSAWNFGKDEDEWAWCQYDAKIRPVGAEGERHEYMRVEQMFSTRPLVGQTGTGWPGTGGGGKPGGGGGGQPGQNQKRCNQENIEDPLLEPIKINGTSVTYTEQALCDRNGKQIRNSGHQLVKGPENEWDHNRSQFTVEQNWPALEYDDCLAKVNCVNGDPIWGFGTREVKLAKFTWRLNLYGICYFYFTRIFEFEVRKKVEKEDEYGRLRLFDGWDRDMDDVGTSVLNGHWDKDVWVIDRISGTGVAPVFPNPTNPSHFRTAIDKQGNPMEIRYRQRGVTSSDLDGCPALVKIKRGATIHDPAPPGFFRVEKYDEADFLELGL